MLMDKMLISCEVLPLLRILPGLTIYLMYYWIVFQLQQMLHLKLKRGSMYFAMPILLFTLMAAYKLMGEKTQRIGLYLLTTGWIRLIKISLAPGKVCILPRAALEMF